MNGANFSNGITLAGGSVISSNTAAPGTSAWYSIYKNTTTVAPDNKSGMGICVDSSGNVYSLGWNQQGADYLFIVKVTSTGTLVWQKKLTTTSEAQPSGITINSNNEIIVAAVFPDTSALLIVKLDDSGNIVWAQETDPGTFGPFIPYGSSIRVGSDNSIYILSDNTSSTAQLIKLTDSGTLTFSLTISPPGFQYLNSGGMKLDDSDNIIFTGSYVSIAAPGYAITKLSSSGSLISAFTAEGIGEQDFQSALQDVAIDSSGNYYVAGYLTGYSPSGSFIFKMDSSGTLIWSRQYGSHGLGFNSIKIDGSYIYCIGNAAQYQPGVGPGPSYVNVVKFDLAGNLIWQRTFRSDTGENNFYDRPHDSLSFNGNYYNFSAYTTTGPLINGNPSVYYMLNAQLPKDGSLTGTYGSMTYEASDFQLGTRDIMIITPTTPTIQPSSITLSTPSVSSDDLLYTLALTLIN